MKIPIRDRRVYWSAMTAALCLAAALGYHVVYGEHGYLAYRREQRQYLELRKKAADLQKENDKLAKEIDALNRHDPAVVEEKAREQQLAKPGEKIYTYAPPGSTETKDPTPPKTRNP